MEESEGKHLTDYDATRWYRPPEVLLCSNSYTEGIDVLAVACTSFTRCVVKINGRDKNAIQHIYIEYSNFLFPIIGNSTLNQVEKILANT